MSEQNSSPNDDYYILLDKIINDKEFLNQISSKEDLDSMYEYSIKVIGDYPKENFFKVIKEIKNISVPEDSLKNVSGGISVGKILINIQEFVENGGDKIIKLLSKF